jgi:ArsR family transcriptional regulator, arsenate/arsenite/antimonite-responsive transcriptional repressor
MPTAKSYRFSEDEIKLAQFPKVLSQPARLAIIMHLVSLNTCCFTDISNELPLADSTVSQHLAELKKAGLIQGSIEPPKIQYTSIMRIGISSGSTLMSLLI